MYFLSFFVEIHKVISLLAILKKIITYLYINGSVYRINKKGKDIIMIFKSQEEMPEQCPPSHAIAENMEPVYRFIENDTIGAIDFLNHKERKKRYPSEKTCEALALSFFTTKRAAQRAGRNFKNLKGKVFVEGKITSECGIHTIENSHLNLWLFQGVNMMKIFLGGEDRGETN